MRTLICVCWLLLCVVCHAGEAGRVAVLAARARFDLQQQQQKEQQDRKALTLGTVPYYQIINGVKHHTSDSHLINEHGYTAEQLRGLTQAEKDLLHGHAHLHHSRTAQQPGRAGPQQPAAATGPVYQIQCNSRSCRRVRIR